MRLGLSQACRKLKKLFEIADGDECTYVLGKGGELLAKMDEKQYCQFFVRADDGKLKLLVLVKGLKRKVDQNLNVISAAIVFEYEEGQFIRYARNRRFVYERDVNLEETKVIPIAEISETAEGLHVKSERLGVDEMLSEVSYLENSHPIYIISERSKPIKGQGRAE